jgi:hypothetical protein
MQLALFAVPRAVRIRVESARRDRGLARAEAAPASQVSRAREIARHICEYRGSVSIEDIREAMPDAKWGNWAGVIFREGFRAVGMTHADHKGSRRRRVMVWAIKEAA